MSSLNVPRGIFRKIDWLVEKVKWLIYKVNSGGGGLNNVSQNSDPNTIAQRQSDGSLVVGDPTGPGDAVNLKTLYTMVTGVNKVYSESAEDFEFDQTGYYTFDSEGDATRVLPTNENSLGRRYVILNTVNAGELTVTGNILEAGVVRTSLPILAGEITILYNNGYHWVIVT